MSKPCGVVLNLLVILVKSVVFPTPPMPYRPMIPTSSFMMQLHTLSSVDSRATVCSSVSAFESHCRTCLNLAVGFLPQVDNSAHIGGFISGLLAVFVLLIRPQFGFAVALERLLAGKAI
ncbi:hypothetical protein F3Y22_tig00016571pilonHSYRG00036 [Hibiscus syriacus]|uniref:RHOMBOID-like protein n=1 Tax=Hibiscus syriacus TaxID=106335 RepID=A0A6A3BWU2_HIBSY|nr:hypothetical protein F3Y22_tig00016571pilonHSYRG00036 [Hibiscus syriacus]